MRRTSGLFEEDWDDEFQNEEVASVMDPGKYRVPVFAEAADAVNWALAHAKDHMEAFKFIRDLRVALEP